MQGEDGKSIDKRNPDGKDRRARMKLQLMQPVSPQLGCRF
jgi:hypothetical protein